MNHVAIDLGSKASQVCIRTADGSIVAETKHPTARLGELMKTWPSSRVILETTSEAFRIAEQARSAGHEVRVVASTLVRQLGVGERGIKTDVRDARKLSEVSCRIDLPSVHVPSETARRLRSMLGSRNAIIETRTKLVNHTRGWLRQQLLRIRSGALSTFPDRVRGAVVAAGCEVPAHIEGVLMSIEQLNLAIAAATKQLALEAKASAVCRRLMSAPGVGPITALSFIAAVDQRERFATAHHVQSYLGVTPGENSSSERQQRTGITKAGPQAVRRVLVQAAWVAWFRRPADPIVIWARQIAERRGKFVAIVALARKLAGILFALWRDGAEYRKHARR